MRKGQSCPRCPREGRAEGGGGGQLPSLHPWLRRLWKFAVSLLDLTKSSCKKRSYRSSRTNRTCGPAIPVQYSLVSRRFFRQKRFQLLTKSMRIKVNSSLLSTKLGPVFSAVCFLKEVGFQWPCTFFFVTNSNIRFERNIL